MTPTDDLSPEFAPVAAALAAAAPPRPPAGFADRVTRAVLRDGRRRRRIAFARRAVAAAAVVMIAWAVRPAPTVRETPTVPPPAPAEAPLSGQFEDARTALVSLTRKTTDETLAPARNLFAGPVRTPPPAPVATADPLADTARAAKAGLEPLANTARRAVNLFVRDVGGAAGAGKVKS